MHRRPSPALRRRKIGCHLSYKHQTRGRQKTGTPICLEMKPASKSQQPAQVAQRGRHRGARLRLGQGRSSSASPSLPCPPPSSPLPSTSTDTDVSRESPSPSPTPLSSSSSSSSSSLRSSSLRRSTTPGSVLVNVKADVLKKLASGEYLAVPKPHIEGVKRIPVWTAFSIVIDRTTKLETGAVQCNRCMCVLTCTSKSGPSSLKKHLELHCFGRLSTALDFTPLPSTLQSMFVDKMADVAALTMGSIHMLTSEPIKNLLQLAMDIASTCKGRVNVNELMPSPQTVINRLSDRAEECRRVLVPRVKEAIADRRCQGTTDMYTCDQTKKHLICITVSFTDKNWEGKGPESHNLVVAEFPASEKAIHTNIKKGMFQAMSKIGFTEKEFNLIEWISDRLEAAERTALHIS